MLSRQGRQLEVAKLQLLRNYDLRQLERSQKEHTPCHSNATWWDLEEPAMTQMSIAQEAETHIEMNLSMCTCQANTNDHETQ